MTDVIQIPQMLFPATDDLSSWSVIACDQFTSNPAYWEGVKALTEGKPSSYHITLPEIYLKGDVDARVNEIHATMDEYLKNGVFRTLEPGFILVERTTPFTAAPRFGLMIAVDLDAYSFETGSKAPIRATEATVVDRIPPRVKVRKGAPLELPHVLMLYNDPKNSVLGEVIQNRESYEKLYDFELNSGGGHLKGYFIPQEKAKELRARFYALSGGESALSNYKNSPLLFAVGDGNHSLASAKACWEAKKETLSDEERLSSPARYALTEAVNIYDESILFGPIHRLIRVDDRERFLSNFESYTAPFEEKNGMISFKGFYNPPEIIRKVDSYAGAYIETFGGEIDFIHSEEELSRLVQADPNAVGVLFNAIEKGNFFDFISQNGNFPRKTFSMGQGPEKRYYLEGKRI